MLSRLLKKSVHTGPSFSKTPYVEGEQLAFYQRLQSALPNCTLFPDVSLASLLTPLANDARHLRQLQERLAGRHMAYGVFNDTLECQCVIELTHAGQQGEQRALTLALLEEGGIPCFSWENGRLPSTDQILRAMAAFTDIVPPRFEAAANSMMRHPPVSPAVVQQAQQAQHSQHSQHSQQSGQGSLTMDDVLKLTRNGNVKAVYPHVWERICLFHNEPRHLEQYLSSLSLQNRGENRNGFPEGVIVELTDLQGANSRFIPAPIQAHSSWNSCFVNI